MVTKWLRTKGKIFQKQKATKSQNEGMVSHTLRYLIRRSSHLLRFCLWFSLEKQSCIPPTAFDIYQILSIFEKRVRSPQKYIAESYWNGSGILSDYFTVICYYSRLVGHNVH